MIPAAILATHIATTRIDYCLRTHCKQEDYVSEREWSCKDQERITHKLIDPNKKFDYDKCRRDYDHTVCMFDLPGWNYVKRCNDKEGPPK